MTWWEYLISALLFSVVATAVITYRIHVAKRRTAVLSMLQSFNFGASVRTIAYQEEMQRSHTRRTVSRDLEWWARKGLIRRKTYGAGITVYLVNNDQ